jgi:hypothetical protein
LDLVRSTAVAENLLAGSSGDAPLPPDLSENVMRPLAKLPPQLQIECWRLASHLTEKPTHFVVSRIVRVVTGAIDQGCGNAQKPKRVECEELSFLRPFFGLHAFGSRMQNCLQLTSETIKKRRHELLLPAGSLVLGAKAFV